MATSYPPVASPQSQPTAPPSGGNMMFASQAPQQSSASEQLLSLVAPISESLRQLAQAAPAMASTVDQMLQLLKSGVIQAASQMQSQPQGGQPPVG